MKISPARADKYSGWAQEFYNPEKPYHNWHHAEEVMDGSLVLINTRGGRWTRQVNRPLLQIAAAWHDAGYDDDERFQYPSPEHYSVHLMNECLKRELSSRHLATMRESILGTRFKAPRETMAAVALHYADVGNMASDYDDFLEHTKRLWSEQRDANWDAWRAKAHDTLGVIAAEAKRELPFIGIDGHEFALNVRENARRLQREDAPE